MQLHIVEQYKTQTSTYKATWPKSFHGMVTLKGLVHRLNVHSIEQQKITEMGVNTAFARLKILSLKLRRKRDNISILYFPPKKLHEGFAHLTWRMKNAFILICILNLFSRFLTFISLNHVTFDTNSGRLLSSSIFLNQRILQNLPKFTNNIFTIDSTSYNSHLELSIPPSWR